MAATFITGATTTGNVGANQMSIEIAKEISLLEPNWQALTVFTREVSVEDTTATHFKWQEDEAKPRFDALSAAVASTTEQAIPVVHGVYFQQWDLVLVTRTGEVIRVDSVVGNTLNVTRGIGSTAANMLENDELYLIGSAQPENDTSKVARSLVPVTFENITGIWRTPYELSETAANVAYQTSPSEWIRKQERAAVEHAKDRELSFLFGRKSSTFPGSAEVRTTGGALSFITSNQMDAGGILSESEFNAFMQSVFRYGSEDKLSFMSGAAIQALGKFPASKQITTNDETTYGMNVTKYTGPFGTINTVYHKMLEGQKYGGYMITLDMRELKYRPLSNRDTKLEIDIQPRDQDGKKAEYKTEAGLQFGQQRTHGLVSGITG